MPTFDSDYFKRVLEDCQEECFKEAPEVESSHRQSFMKACQLFYDLYQKIKTVKSEDEMGPLAKQQEKAMKKCVKTASKILDSVDLNAKEEILGSILKGMIITKATPKGLGAFCALDKKHNVKAVGGLLKSADLMKEMLINGGAKGGNYGQATVIYNKLKKKIPEKDESIYKKLAMAVALELAVPVHEFDTEIEVDPIERYGHFVDAYKNGELDPAFPHFSVWELRQVVNCDAKNDQMKWGRDMVMNYAPYLTILTIEKEKYNFICKTDVLMRTPTWTSSPRTYQQVLSGGGKDKPNAWFGRFIAKAHGIPTWGCQQGAVDAFTRWTSSGWETMMNADWGACEWEGVHGSDFKGEVDVRSVVSPKEYFDKLVLLECLAEVLEGRHKAIPEEEKNILHPLRVWRSLSIIQRALMAAPGVPENFGRTGSSKVQSRLAEYLERSEFEQPAEETRVEDGVLIIPVSKHGYADGPMNIIDSFAGGMQLNFAGGEAKVEFTLPDDLGGRKVFSIEVCSVHLKQNPLKLMVDGGEPISIEVPYTVGEWSETVGVNLEVSGGEIVSISREKGSFGLAARNLMLKN